eukprot:351732-Chlamydomonas_euryale.AAC.13
MPSPPLPLRLVCSLCDSTAPLPAERPAGSLARLVHLYIPSHVLVAHASPSLPQTLAHSPLTPRYPPFVATRNATF